MTPCILEVLADEPHGPLTAVDNDRIPVTLRPKPVRLTPTTEGDIGIGPTILLQRSEAFTGPSGQLYVRLQREMATGNRHQRRKQLEVAKLPGCEVPPGRATARRKQERAARQDTTWYLVREVAELLPAKGDATEQRFTEELDDSNLISPQDEDPIVDRWL